MSEISSLTVNGRPRALPDDIAPETPLLDILRNTLRLTGTRFGCGLEQCGACMVLVDGAPVQSCNAALDAVAGKEITTIEGLAGNDGTLHPLQQAFLDEQAGQCGYCLSGIFDVGESASGPRTRTLRGMRSPRRWTTIFVGAVPMYAF